MVPNVVGLLTMILVSRTSDRKLERRWHVAIPAMIGGIACVMFGAAHSVFISVVLLSVAVGCVCGYPGPFWLYQASF
jgi:MFS transporter, ACS family, tartrate transporter